MNEHPSDPLPRWLADAACRDVVSRAARLTDLQAHDEFAALFTDDAELQRPGGETLHGRAAIVAAYRARPAGRLTRHLLGGTVVDLLGDDEATAHTAVLLYRSSEAEPVGAFGRAVQGPAVVGSFDDRLRRGADGRWRISRRVARFEMHTPDAA